MYNKRYLRIWLLVLILLAVLLVLHNLQQARQLKVVKVELVEKASTTKSLENEITRLPETGDLQGLLNCKYRSLRYQRLQHGDYWLVQNLIVGRKSRNIDCAESITYTTNGDYTFFDNVEIVAKRWLAPISFAIYAPGHDVNPTLDAIQYVRNCLPDSELIVDYVTFHIFFPNNHMPAYVPLDEAEALDWPYNCIEANGTLALPPYAQLPHTAMYRVQKNLTYPINVGRNIARNAANTYFIFACDIELYPSLGFVEQFMDMVARNYSVLALDSKQPRRVYPLPVFEIAENETVPNNKAELMQLLDQKRAQVFHSNVCKQCHRVPDQDEWMMRPANSTCKLELFSKGVRTGQFKYWEPFYVSDNTEPQFDERVTWEGQSNKRIQGYAMCLLGYEYHVLHPAFLIHHPGIKKTPRSNDPRFQYAKQMSKFIKTKIEPEYKVLFGRNKDCTT